MSGRAFNLQVCSSLSSSSSRSIIESCISRVVSYARMQSITGAVREREGAAEVVTIGGEHGTAGASKVRRGGRESRVSD